GSAAPAKRGGVVSSVIDDPPVASLDVGTRLDAEGIAVRTGHHCCQPVMDRFCVPSTARMSVALYNTTEEIDALADALRRIVTEESARSRSRAAAAVPAEPPQSGLRFPEPAAGSPR